MMLWFIVLFTLALILPRLAIASQEIGAPLSLEQIIDLHKNEVPCRPLVARVAERGVNFAVTADVIKKLKMEQVCDLAIAEVKRKGEELEERKKFAEEKKKFEEEKKASRPKTPPPEQVRLVNLGMEMIRKKNYQEALEQSERALKLNPDYHKAWDLQGDALRGLKRYREAVASYDRALMLDPVDPIIWSHKGLALQDLSQHAEAIQSFDKALNINPEMPLVLLLKGDSSFALKRCDEARISYDRALEINPKLNLTLEERYQRLKNCGA